MTPRTRRWLPALGIALLAAVVLAGFAEAQQPKRGGVLNIADPVGPPCSTPTRTTPTSRPAWS